jgi:hypothetical protein
LFSAGFCKQQLWPLFHYVLPMSPSSAGRFNSELWQAYVKANKVIEWTSGTTQVNTMYGFWNSSSSTAYGVQFLTDELAAGAHTSCTASQQAPATSATAGDTSSCGTSTDLLR